MEKPSKYWQLNAVRVSFGGSFQCRLATDPDPSDWSPSDPFGQLRSPRGLGWTFAYNEPPFDRVIRFSNPVQIRNALVDPWVNTRVTGVQVKLTNLAMPSVNPDWTYVPTDPLMNVGVSLGNRVFFDTKRGGGSTGFEALMEFRFALGSSLFTASASGLPKLQGVERDQGVMQEYLNKKPMLIASATMDPIRLQTLTTPVVDANGQIMLRTSPLAQFFSYTCRSGRILLRDVAIDQTVLWGLVAAGAQINDWEWWLEAAFSRFDGDTLTGQVEGLLSGRYLPILSPGVPVTGQTRQTSRFNRLV
jgi:hypothetical protein